MGQTNFDVVQANAFIGSDFLTQGKTFFVKPRTGLDGNDGLSPATAVKTLKAALALATANQNDVVYLMAESNTAGSTTDYQSATLDWNKDLVHLIGVNCGPALHQRSRVALISSFVTASNLFTLSANGCLIKGIEFFAGVASVVPLGGFKLTGTGNHIVKCQIAGIGHANMDIAGAYSLLLAGEENLFEDCVIGVDTVTLGANLNSQILTGLGCTRNIFRNCKVLTYSNHATNSLFVRAPQSTIDRWLIFEDCQFINPDDAGSTTLTHGSAITASGGSPSGSVLLIGPKTALFGASGWNATNTGDVVALGGAPVAGTYGVSVDVTG